MAKTRGVFAISFPNYAGLPLLFHVYSKSFCLSGSHCAHLNVGVCSILLLTNSWSFLQKTEGLVTGYRTCLKCV